MKTRREVPWPMLGSPDGTVPNVPSPEGRELGAGMARFCEEALAKFPELEQPCEDCAFRSGTVPNQCATTQMDALKCMMEGIPFGCHHRPGMPLCAGWVALMKARPAPPAAEEHTDDG